MPAIGTHNVRATQAPRTVGNWNSMGKDFEKQATSRVSFRTLWENNKEIDSIWYGHGRTSFKEVSGLCPWLLGPLVGAT